MIAARTMTTRNTITTATLAADGSSTPLPSRTTTINPSATATSPSSPQALVPTTASPSPLLSRPPPPPSPSQLWSLQRMLCSRGDLTPPGMQLSHEDSSCGGGSNYMARRVHPPPPHLPSHYFALRGQRMRQWGKISWWRWCWIGCARWWVWWCWCWWAMSQSGSWGCGDQTVDGIATNGL